MCEEKQALIGDDRASKWEDTKTEQKNKKDIVENEIAHSNFKFQRPIPNDENRVRCLQAHAALLCALVDACKCTLPYCVLVDG